MRSPFLLSIFFLLVGLPGQKPTDPALSIGDSAPALRGKGLWFRGTRIVKKSPPKTFVLVLFEPGEERAGLLRSLGDLEKSLRKSSMKVLAVLLAPEGGDRGAGLKKARSFFRKHGKKLRFPMGFDKGAGFQKSWLQALGSPKPPLAVIVKEGKIQYLGAADANLPEKVQNVLDGALDLGGLWLKHNKASRTKFGMFVIQRDIKGLYGFVDGLLKKFPTSKALLAQKYWAMGKLEGKEKAEAYLQKKLDLLRTKNPFAAVELIQELVQTRPSKPLLDRALGILNQLAKKKGAVGVRAAVIQIHALDGLKKVDEVRKVAEASFKRFRKDPVAVRKLSVVLCNTAVTEKYKDLLLPMFEARIAFDPKDIEAIRVRWELCAFLFDDPNMRRKATEAYAAHLGLQDDLDLLNGFAWNLLTDRAFGPRDYPFALKAAKRILEFPKVPHHILDTVALAYFKNGDKANAIKIQEKALAKAEKAGDAKAAEGYRKQLEKFRK
jgi:regulator of sirC expression with transglutaminase-like and TPR domain